VARRYAKDAVIVARPGHVQAADAMDALMEPPGKRPTHIKRSAVVMLKRDWQIRARGGREQNVA
jgi:hypothetical protein